ncbi:glycosyltransferase [Chryseobacterium sp. VAUSW3]|uniref:glycosyltransferase n=1 Tax=Chryseobacterium sp. VAUSW3 TaxID=2010998 RepID=UPI000B4DC905|nr:glycosyltransferase [Chryseobacterium sp. VAUSW3]OWR15177.1 glycosyltransferase [Chryseobacterium sp. VAUSW3]
MKILRLTTLLDFGGQEKKYLSFTENPELLRHQYVFSAIGYGGNAERKLKERGFEVHVLNRNFSIRNLSNIWAVYRLIKKIRPDVVHAAAAEANFHGIIAAKLAGVKTILGEEIGIPNHSSIAQKVFRWVYRFADQVIGVSQSVKNHLVNTGEIPESKGKVIYNPVSIPTPFPRKNSPNFEIVYVGRLEIVKNVETLITAFAHSNNAHTHLTIVGDGRERHHLEGLTSTLHMDSKITFTGFNSEPSKYLSNADLFVLPSFSEGFGIAAAEAMFLKIPVLCSMVGGIPEFVKDGESGWLFDPKNTAELTEKLNQIIEMDAESLHLIGRNGYDKVINQFTVERYIENLESFYHQLNHD